MDEGLPGIDAQREDGELLADVETHRTESSHQAVQEERAQHGAVVVGDQHDDRLLAEVVAQADCLAGLVGEGEVQGQLRAQFLVEADLFQEGLVLRVGLLPGVGEGDRGGDESEADSHSDSDQERGSERHRAPPFTGGVAGAAGFGVGRPRSRTNRMARSIGIRAIPASLLTQA